MAKPSYLQRLDKGKLLTGNNFPEFVNTWNYTVNRLDNLKGDRDTNPQEGHITIDEADPEHPVIRFVKEASEGDGEDGVITLEGDGDGSEPVQGYVSAQGAEGSGLVVRTTPDEVEEDEPPSGTLEIDVADRSEDEEYGGREIEMNGETVAKVFGTTDFEITQKEIVAGDGIVVEDDGETITISATGEETEIEAGAGIEVDEETVSVNPDGVSVETRSGSAVADKKVQLVGFNQISNYKTQTSLGEDLLAEYESGDLSLVATLVGSSYVLRYKPIGVLDIDAEEGSGLKVEKETGDESSALRIDVADRGSDTLALHEVKLGSSETGVKVFGTAGVDVLDVQAGEGVSISKSGNVATISVADGAISDVVSGSDEITCTKNGTVVTVSFEGKEEEEETEGYTGTETVVTNVTYSTSTHSLTKFYKTFTFSNGVLTDVSDEESTVIETAVQEAASVS